MSEQTKKCYKCGEVKARSDFYKCKSRKDGLQSKCKACSSDCNAKWFARNRERDLARQAEWRSGNRERERARQAKYRAENPEYQAKYRSENREKENSRIARWNKANPEKRRALDQRRRARNANAQGTHTAEQLKARFDYHGNKCVYCNSTGNLHADHMIPLSRGGTNFASNMVPACGSCNRSKGAKTPIEFAEYTFKQLQAMLGK